MRMQILGRKHQMTYVHGESKLAKARAAIEAARLEEAQAMNALIRQHTAALRRRYNENGATIIRTAAEQAQALLDAARLAQEWAETRWPDDYTTCRARLDAAAKEAATIPDRRTQTKHKQTERSVSNAGRSGVSRMGVAA
jgi:TRAP-type C4-dicarboxylate transport system substrate-binding protein